MLTQVEILKKYHVPVRGHQGQHLLIDPNVQRKIVECLGFKTGDTVLEVGPGLGSLTAHLLECGARVTAVEKDKRFLDILRAELLPLFPDTLNLVHADFLKQDLDKLAGSAHQSLKFISNLPYYITAPILFHLLPARQKISEAVVMMQKEVAERLIADPGTKAYGRLSVAYRFYAQVEQCFDVSKHCFIPKPQVDSRVVRIRFHDGPEAIPADHERALFRLISVAFSQRRKQLLSLLKKDAVWGKDKERLHAILVELGLGEHVRGEELLLKDFLALSQKLG